MPVWKSLVNNPIRLVLGWCVIVGNVLPPSSILLTYWMAGAFLMAIKRYSELRFIDNPTQASLYRKSFIHYSEETLLLSAFFYALTASFLLADLGIALRVTRQLVAPLPAASIPFVSVLFVWYLYMGMRDESIAQSPEKLYQQKGFVAFVLSLMVLLILLSFINIPWLNILLHPVIL